MEKSGKGEQIVKELKTYVNLKIDAFKLTAVEQLSLLFSRGLSVVVAILMIGMALLMFTVAVTLLLGEWIGSVLWAVVIMGLLFTLCGLMLFARREHLFSDSMVRMFSRMFFSERFENNEKDDE